MVTRLLLPDPFSLGCQDLSITPDQVTISLRPTTSAAACPICGESSSRIHSRYVRTLADLPWQGRPVRLQVEVRRFFCDTPACPRRIFAERLPGVANVYARKTARLAQAFRWIGFACGGEEGSRLAGHLGMSTIADVLLRLIRYAPSPSLSTPRVLGVDDWAWHKGQRYGTILCALERHRTVDLLVDRAAETLESWLRAHPGIEVIGRDRGTCYAQGASAGAPKTRQVADRWHLMHNLQEALVRMLDRHHRDLSEAARDVAAVAQLPSQEKADKPTEAAQAPSTPTWAQQASEARRERRFERYTQVITRH